MSVLQRTVHLIEVSIKRESTVYRIQVVASVGKMTLQINSGLLWSRTVKKDTEMVIIIHLLVRSEICRMSSLHYPIPSTHILTLRYPPSPLTLTNPLSPSHCLLNKHKLLVDHLPACRRLLFPLLHAEKPLFRVQQRK